MKKLFLLIATVLFTWSAFANPGEHITGSVTLGTDYSTRGISQVGDDFAIQGSIATTIGGVTTGIWTSSVQFDNDGAYAQVDFFAKFSTNVLGTDFHCKALLLNYRGGNKDSYIKLVPQFKVNAFSVGALIGLDSFEKDDSTAEDYDTGFLTPFVGVKIVKIDIPETDIDIDVNVQVGTNIANEVPGKDWNFYQISTAFDVSGLIGQIAFTGTDVEDSARHEPRLSFSLTKKF